MKVYADFLDNVNYKYSLLLTDYDIKHLIRLFEDKISDIKMCRADRIAWWKSYTHDSVLECDRNIKYYSHLLSKVKQLRVMSIQGDIPNYDISPVLPF